MKRFSLYGVISVISIIVRQFFLPNPFDCFGDKAVLINWIVEPILHLIAYGLVGLVYCRGSFPAIREIDAQDKTFFFVVMTARIKFNFNGRSLSICSEISGL